MKRLAIAALSVTVMILIACDFSEVLRHSGYGCGVNNAPGHCEAVLRWREGHPRMVQQVCRAVPGKPRRGDLRDKFDYHYTCVDPDPEPTPDAEPTPTPAPLPPETSS